MPEGGDQFDAKLQAWRHKVFHISHFLQSDMVLEIVGLFFMKI